MRIWPDKLVDQEFADLGTAGFFGTLNDRQFAYLRNQGYDGGLADMMFQWKVSGGSPPVFTPASLFAASEGGVWGEVTTANLWQDVARTTPVTAAGQPVASWRLNTASGVVYAEQATPANRPIYEVDSGLGCLDCDGVFQHLLVSSVDLSARDEITVVIGAIREAGTSYRPILELGNTYDTQTGVFTVGTAGTILYFGSKGTTGALPQTTLSLPDRSVITGLGDISSPVATLRVNGTQVAQVTTSQGTGNFGNHPLYIGQRPGFAAPCRIFSMIVRGATTSGADLTNAEAWVDARTNP